MYELSFQRLQKRRRNGAVLSSRTSLAVELILRKHPSPAGFFYSEMVRTVPPTHRSLPFSYPLLTRTASIFFPRILLAFRPKLGERTFFPFASSLGKREAFISQFPPCSTTISSFFFLQKYKRVGKRGNKAISLSRTRKEATMQL